MRTKLAAPATTRADGIGDPNDAGPLDVNLLRMARDVRMASMGGPAVTRADIAPLRPRTDAVADDGDDPVSLAKARHEKAMRDAWKPGAA